MQATDTVRVAFYNVENFFDYFDDSLKADEAFTPRGVYAWTKARYETKCSRLFKVIASLGETTGLPMLIGFCEIENNKVLSDLIYGTPLRKYGYRYVHHESADARGIDVALIYRPQQFAILEEQPVHIVYAPDTVSRTRDILYVKGVVLGVDTLHVFVCHFPSKYGGLLATVAKRAHTATTLKNRVDSILNVNNDANIVIMGDFNDEPTDESMIHNLAAQCDTTNLTPYSLVNLMCPFVGKHGSHKYREQWSIIDQIIVSKGLFLQHGNLSIRQRQAHIFEAPFLLIEDATYWGKKPYRTYVGMKYQGGYSDHLPVYVDLVIIEN
ncbi:endonuclease [Bacteroidia bacterium]|nr:endonuclease [Bacteroidia bacterium]